MQQLAVQMLLPLLGAADSLSATSGDRDAAVVCLESVLRAAAWVVAEYGDNGEASVEAAAKLRKVFDLLVRRCVHRSVGCWFGVWRRCLPNATACVQRRWTREHGERERES